MSGVDLADGNGLIEGLTRTYEASDMGQSLLNGEEHVLRGRKVAEGGWLVRQHDVKAMSVCSITLRGCNEHLDG